MKDRISDEMIAYAGMLAELSLSEEEKEQAKQDMCEMLEFVDKMKELDTAGVKPMSHVLSVENVFREDVVENGDEREEILANAPVQTEHLFVVPKTVD